MFKIVCINIFEILFLLLSPTVTVERSGHSDKASGGTMRDSNPGRDKRFF